MRTQSVRAELAGLVRQVPPQGHGAARVGAGLGNLQRERPADHRLGPTGLRRRRRDVGQPHGHMDRHAPRARGDLLGLRHLDRAQGAQPSPRRSTRRCPRTLRPSPGLRDAASTRPSTGGVCLSQLATQRDGRSRGTRECKGYRDVQRVQGGHRARIPRRHSCGSHRHRPRSKPPLVREPHRQPAGDRRGHGAVPPRRVAARRPDAGGHPPVPDPHGSDPFDERQPGLDHVAFACANRAELEQWESKLNELGIENGGIVDAPYGSGLSFRDPDNIALEFFAPPG